MSVVCVCVDVQGWWCYDPSTSLSWVCRCISWVEVVSPSSSLSRVRIPRTAVAERVRAVPRRGVVHDAGNGGGYQPEKKHGRTLGHHEGEVMRRTSNSYLSLPARRSTGK